MTVKDEKIEIPTLADVESVEDVSSVEEAIGKISMILAKSEKIKVLTDLDDEEIKQIAALLVVADVVDDKNLENFCNNFMELRVSKKRLGRRELLDLAKSSGRQAEQRLGFVRRIFGGGQNTM